MANFISVIIPCYNVENHLDKCVESMLAQTYTNFELILINDGSTDGTGKMLDAYLKKDNRVRIYHKVNGGVSSARNLGLQKAIGDAIIFIDGDDYIRNNFIEQLLTYYSEEFWPISGMVNIRNDNHVKNLNFENLLKKFNNVNLTSINIFELLNKGAIGSPCARIYSNKIIKDNTLVFNEEISYQEDLLFDLSYLPHVKYIKLVDYFGYFYVEHKTSSTGRYHKNFNQIAIIYSILKFYLKTEQDEIYLKEFILQSMLRKISNIFHGNSILSERSKFYELRSIFHSDYFEYSRDFVTSLNINGVLKNIIYNKKMLNVYLYFKITTKIKKNNLK